MDLDSTILSVLAAGTAECRAAVETHGGLFTSLFIVGLLGSLTQGTMPVLVAVGLAGHVTGRTWQSLAARLMPAVMLINAAALGYLAWRPIS